MPHFDEWLIQMLWPVVPCFGIIMNKPHKCNNLTVINHITVMCLEDSMEDFGKLFEYASSPYIVFSSVLLMILFSVPCMTRDAALHSRPRYRGTGIPCRMYFPWHVCWIPLQGWEGGSFWDPFLNLTVALRYRRIYAVKGGRCWWRHFSLYR